MRLRFLPVLAMLLCSPALAQAELVAYWPFEEFPDELSTPDVANDYHMELLSNGVFDSANHVDGKFGKAFEFFGNGDASLFYYTQQDEDDKLPINLQPEWTISMWAKVPGEGQNDLRLFSESNTQGNGDPLFNIGTAHNGVDGSLDIYIRNNQASTGTVNHPHTTALPFENEWSHIGWTYADGMHNVWINGFLDSSYPMQSFGEIDPHNIDTTTIGGILRENPSHHVTGIIDEVAIWDEVLPGGTIFGLATEQTNPMDALEYEGALPPKSIGDAGEIVSALVTGARTNQLFGEIEGDPVSGLGQSWYAGGNPGSKAGVDALFESNDPIVPYFQGEEMTWWSGSQDVLDVQKYPGDFDGLLNGDPNNHNNYTVKLEGELLVEESGTVRFLDGVDDYTYFAIDMDRSGVAGDSDEEVIINDNRWTNALSNANGGAPIVEVEFEGIADGGEWLAIELNMSEGGGGDHGMLYWDVMDEDDFFPLDQGEGVVEEDAAVFMIPDSHLRSPESPAPLLSADILGSVEAREGGWEVDVNPADGTSDAFGLENPDDSIFTTIMDVEGVEFHINPLGEVAEGTSFQLIVADSVMGMPVIATEGWSFNAATGMITFGPAAMALEGDIDGDGTVAFGDFLILSAAFGNAVEAGTGADIDGDGTIAFGDFLILSANFGQTAAAAAVPEPASWGMLALAGLAAGRLRRRRR